MEKKRNRRINLTYTNMLNNYQSQFPKKHNHDSRFDEDILIFSLFLSLIITTNVVMLSITELSSSAKSLFF